MKLPDPKDIFEVHVSDVYIDVKDGKHHFWQLDPFPDPYDVKVCQICEKAIKEAIKNGELK